MERPTVMVAVDEALWKRACEIARYAKYQPEKFLDYALGLRVCLFEKTLPLAIAREAAAAITFSADRSYVVENLQPGMVVTRTN